MHNNLLKLVGKNYNILTIIGLYLVKRADGVLKYTKKLALLVQYDEIIIFIRGRN